jgi:hypothetical protein
MDFTGGLPAEAELVTVSPPDDDPYFGENHALWLWDDDHRIGVHLYLKTLQHLGNFRLRRETINVHLPDGTTLMSEQDGPGTVDPRIARGPVLECECVEPFRRWTFRYDATAQPSRAVEMQAGLLRHMPLVPLKFVLDITMAAPPWQLGTFTENDEAMEWGRQFIGTKRYEQLLTATGTITTRDGVLPVTAGGMRTHRVGTRNTGTFPGHTWSTAIFPSGKSFGVQRFCGADGVSQWEEAYVSDGSTIVAAKVRKIPLFSGALPGERLDITLESSAGTARVHGELMATNFVSSMPLDRQRFCWGVDRSNPDNRIMSQGLARYEWDGEIGSGMSERSVRVFELPEFPSAS